MAAGGGGGGGGCLPLALPKAEPTSTIIALFGAESGRETAVATAAIGREEGEGDEEVTYVSDLANGRRRCRRRSQSQSLVISRGAGGRSPSPSSLECGRRRR